MRPPPPSAFAPAARTPAVAARSTLALLVVIAAVSLVSWLVFERMGLPGLMVMTGLLSVGIVFTAVSYRYLIVPVLIWFIALLGFRGVLMLHTPGLPDISPDRMLLVWIASVFLLKMALGEKPHARWSLLDTLLIVHLLYLLGSVMVHEKSGLNSWTVSYLMGYAAYFIGKYLIDGRWDLIRIIFGFLLAMNLYYGFTAVAEYFKLNAVIWPKLVLDPRVYSEWPGRSHGVFLQPAVYGIVMGMLVPIQIYYIRATRNLLLRALLYLSLPMVLAGIYFTYTRGSWLVGIFGLLAVGVIGWRRYGFLVARMALVGVLILATGLINFQRDALFVERVGTEGTITGRLAIFGRAWRVFTDHPVFGVGYFRYVHVKHEYVGTIEVPIYGVIKRGHDVGASIHDIYLGTLAEEGLVGTALHLAIYLQIFLMFRKRYRLRQRGDPFATSMMPVIGGIIVGYYVGGLSIDYRFFSAMIAILYLMVGLIAGYRPAAEVVVRPRPRPAMRLIHPVRDGR